MQVVSAGRGDLRRPHLKSRGKAILIACATAAATDSINGATTMVGYDGPRNRGAVCEGSQKPKRSILFVWHTGEEEGLWGANWFTAHPTVPLDSIVGQLNVDMVGRGGASDVTGEDLDKKLLMGGEGYVQLIGSRRLSTEMGDLVEKVNTEKKLGLRFDYAMDANGHQQNIYCRSDHYEYAIRHPGHVHRQVGMLTTTR
jgi:Zn-dependent M28 family amino/carboxypeptidase